MDTMKYIYVLLILSLISLNSIAQSKDYDLLVGEFETNYNSGNYDMLYSSFSKELQQVLSKKEAMKFFSDIRLQIGNITDKQLITLNEDNSKSYKISFEQSEIQLNISFGNDNKITEIQFNPYKKEEVIENTVTNALSGLSDQYSDLFFEKVKPFPNRTQLSIAFIKNGEVSYYGVKKENDTIKNIDNEYMIFEIGSITKVFTATLLANAVLNGQIGWDDEINSYYNFAFKDEKKLYFKDLANHTSGLESIPGNLKLEEYLTTSISGASVNPYKSYSENQLEVYLKDDVKLREGQKEYNYSNFGAGLLGYTLCLADKSSLNDLYKKNIFDKYGMRNTYSNIKDIETNFVKGLNGNGDETCNWVWDSDVLMGAGGLLSCVSDLAKFAIAHFDDNNRELAMTRKATFKVSEVLKVGLGWHIIVGDGQELHWHNGGTGGYTSSMILDVEKKNGVIILSNISSFSQEMKNIDELSFGLMKLINNIQ